MFRKIRVFKKKNSKHRIANQRKTSEIYEKKHEKLCSAVIPPDEKEENVQHINTVNLNNDILQIDPFMGISAEPNEFQFDINDFLVFN